MTKTMNSKFSTTDKFSNLKISEGQTIVNFATEWVAATEFTLAMAGREAEFVALATKNKAYVAPAQYMQIIKESLTTKKNEDGEFSTPPIFAILEAMGIDALPDFVIVWDLEKQYKWRVYLENGAPVMAEQLPAWMGQESYFDVPAHVCGQSLTNEVTIVIAVEKSQFVFEQSAKINNGDGVEDVKIVVEKLDDKTDGGFMVSMIIGDGYYETERHTNIEDAILSAKFFADNPQMGVM